MLNTPILFLVFNRPDTTKQVFAKIREIQPKQLFIAADGPRINKEGEKEKTEAVRELILNNIDWDCEVKTLFREKNLGCGNAVSEGITWFFENVEEGIILEDDTLPDLSFFPFCEELLEYYKDNERVMHISGSNLISEKLKISEGYYVSKYPTIWGWATWKKAWLFYTYNLEKVDYSLLKQHLNTFFYQKTVDYWLKLLSLMQSKDKIDTWDLQWSFSLWQAKGVAIVPNINLVSNIGFNEFATHTTNQESNLANVSSASYRFPIKHVKKIIVNKKADNLLFKMGYQNQVSLVQKVKNKIKSVLKLK